MDNLQDLLLQSLDDTRYLPEGSSRQVIRAELRKRAYTMLKSKYSNSRREMRSLARSIGNDLWKKGERLSAFKKPPS